MKIKPHVSNGRFYNHAQDAIRPRFKNMLKTTLHIARTRMKDFISSLPGSKEQKSLLNDWISPTINFLQQSDDLRITWLGHATFLVQVANVNILIDPVFYEISRAAPRYIRCPIQPSQLPRIDIVLISHNHRDHLDEASIKALKHHNPYYYVPSGNKLWFSKRGIHNVIEMTWWEDIVISLEGQQYLRLTFLPASHWTSRGLFDINKSLWGSWMISTEKENIYCAGDTAYDQHFLTIKKYFGHIKVALMPIGPVEPRDLIAEAHMGPEEAVQAFLDLDACHFIPMHWGTFMFGLDTFILPIERLKAVWERGLNSLTTKNLHIVKMGHELSFDIQAFANQVHEEGF